MGHRVSGTVTRVRTQEPLSVVDRTRSRLLGKALFFIICLCHRRERARPIRGANAPAPAVDRGPRYQNLSHVAPVKKPTAVAMRESRAILIPRATAYGPAAWPLRPVNFWVGRVEEAHEARPYPGEALVGE